MKSEKIKPNANIWMLFVKAVSVIDSQAANRKKISARLAASATRPAFTA